MRAGSDPATETDHGLVEAILGVDWARAKGRTPDKAAMLRALEARRELVHRLVRWRWLAIEDARAAGATWSEIDEALGTAPGRSCTEYHRKLAVQIRRGLCDADRRDPGSAQG